MINGLSQSKKPLVEILHSLNYKEKAINDAKNAEWKLELNELRKQNLASQHPLSTITSIGPTTGLLPFPSSILTSQNTNLNGELITNAKTVNFFEQDEEYNLNSGSLFSTTPANRMFSKQSSSLQTPGNLTSDLSSVLSTLNEQTQLARENDKKLMLLNQQELRNQTRIAQEAADEQNRLNREFQREQKERDREQQDKMLNLIQSLSNQTINNQNSSQNNSQNSRIYVPKLQTQTQFFGNKSDKINIKSWLDSIKNNMIYSQVDEKNWVRCASIYLQGAAQIEFNIWRNSKTSIEQNNMIWNDFEKLMNSHFMPIDHISTTMSKLLHCKQQNSVANFNEYFNSLLTQLDSTKNQLPEVMLVQTYIDGLHTHIREHLNLLQITTYREAMQKALLFDSSTPSHRQSYNDRDDSRNSVRYIRTNTNNNKSNHRFQTQNGSGNGNGYTNSNANANTNQNQKSSQKPFENSMVDSSSDTELEESTNGCNHCQRNGHTDEECWKKFPDLKPKKSERYNNQSDSSKSRPQNSSILTIATQNREPSHSSNGNSDRKIYITMMNLRSK
jgi:hypothetical protein